MDSLSIESSKDNIQYVISVYERKMAMFVLHQQRKTNYLEESFQANKVRLTLEILHEKKN